MSTTRLDLTPNGAILRLDAEPKLDELLAASRDFADVRTSWATVVTMTALVLAVTLIQLALKAPASGCLIGVFGNLLFQAAFYQWRVYYQRNRFKRLKQEWLQHAEESGWDGVKKAKDTNERD